MKSNRYNNLFSDNNISDLSNASTKSYSKPFALSWLNNAHYETLLPNSTWEKVYDEIIKEFCQRLTKQFTNDERKQALLDLLGKTFASKYFPSEEINNSIIKPPNMPSQESISLYKEAESWLNVNLQKCMEEKGIFDKNNPNEACESVRKYCEQASKIFENHYHVQLAIRETEYLKDISTTTPNFRDPHKLELGHKPQTAVSSVFDHELPYTVHYISKDGPEMMIAPPPHWFSVHSEFTGESLVSICQNNEEQIEHICREMIGRRLPISLKRVIWKYRLLKTENNGETFKIPNGDLEEVYREKFTRSVTRGLTELKANKDTRTPVNELLENLIIEHYEKSPPLSNFCKDLNFLSEAVRILNLLYAYDRSYEPFLVFWLFPFHFGFRRSSVQITINRIEFEYDIAMCLSLFMRSIYPKWNVIFRITQEILDVLKTEDPDFYNHLDTIANIDMTSKPKEFMVNILEVERSTMSNKSKIRIASSMRTDIVNPSVIFIRKWIGDAFVSVLRNAAVIFIFDQFFMSNMSEKVFHASCLSILQLLRPSFMKCINHAEMKKTFLIAPSSLYTLDFIRSWNWIYNNKPIQKVPEFNRLNHKKSVIQPIVSPPINPPIERSVPLILPQIGFANIRAELRITDTKNEIDPSDVLLSISLLLGDKEVHQIASKINPELQVSSTLDELDLNRKVQLIFKDEFEFKNLDVNPMSSIYQRNTKIKFICLLQSKSKDSIYGWCILDGYVEEEDEIDNPKTREFNLEENEVIKENGTLLKGYILRISTQPFQGRTFNLINEEIPLDIYKKSKDNSIGNKGIPKLEPGSILNISCFNPLEKPIPKSSVDIPAPEILPEPNPPTQKPKQNAKPLKTQEPPKEQKPKVSNSWIPFNPDSYNDIKPIDVSRADAFCLYVDQLKFLPDNASIVKVTGRFLQTGSDDDIPDILIFPNVESDPRSPTFLASSRFIVNKNKNLILEKSTILLLRIYTVVRTNLEIVVIGNCIIPIFNQEEDILLSGCYQKRLRNSLPDLGLISSNSLSENSLDSAPFIDGVSILFRLWPMTDEPINSPGYEIGVYQSQECKPTEFESNLFDLYTSLGDKQRFYIDYRDLVRNIKSRDKDLNLKDKAVTHNFMMSYIPRRLDIIRYLQENQAPRHVDKRFMFHYRLEKGLWIQIDRVYGLNTDLFVFATIKILRGSESAGIPAKPDKNFGIDQFYISSKLDPNYPLRSCKFNDPHKKIQPYYDENSIAIVQIWGLKMYLQNGEFYDVNTEEKITKLSSDNQLGWIGIEIIKNGFVQTGLHQTPLIKDPLNVALLKRIQSEGILKVITNREINEHDSASLSVQIFDGHLEVAEYGEDIPTISDTIDASSNKDALYRVLSASAGTSGKLVSAEIADCYKNGSEDDFLQKYESFTDQLVNSVKQDLPFQPIIF